MEVNKFIETRNKKQETRNKKQETRNKKAIPVALNYVKTGKLLTIAICLQARDYKGFNTGSQLMNGVLVIDECNKQYRNRKTK